MILPCRSKGIFNKVNGYFILVAKVRLITMRVPLFCSTKLSVYRNWYFVIVTKAENTVCTCNCTKVNNYMLVLLRVEHT